MDLQPSLLIQFCKLLFDQRSAAAICTQEGWPIYLKYDNLAEIGTLPTMAQTTQQYLNLQDGEVSISNDPYSGGTILSNFYLSMGLSSEKKRSRNSDLILTIKFSLKPKIGISESIEFEGVRVPPTPIASQGKINNDILNAIAAHPQCPEGFNNSVLQCIEELNTIKNQFYKMNEVFGIDWSKPQLKQYFKDSKSAMASHLSQISSGEKTEQIELNDGSLLRLRVEVRDEKVIFDFSGSDNSKAVQITHSAVLGGCVGALISILEKELPINQGVFECLEVVAPEGTLVHAKFPRPVFFGMTDGISAIANLVLKTVGNLDKSKKFPLSGTSYCNFSIEFSPTEPSDNSKTNGTSYFFETVEPGCGASKISSGKNGINIWKRSQLQPSIEEIERRFPLLVESVAIRQNSGGVGKFQGGNGIIKTFQVLAPSRLTWSIFEPSEKPLGASGGREAEAAEFLLQRNGKDKSILAKEGRIDLHSHDKIIVQSAGGGGFGNSDDE